MTKQELKKQLNSYRDIKAEREQLLGEIERLESVMYSPKSPNMDGMPRGAGGGDPILRAVSRHTALIDLYQVKCAQLLEAQTAIEKLIEQLPIRERRLFRCRYIDGMTWEDVCETIGYSWRQTHKIHSRALDKLVERVNNPEE